MKIKKQILKIVIPKIKHHTYHTFLMNNQEKIWKKNNQEKNWDTFFQNISLLYIKKINF